MLSPLERLAARIVTGPLGHLYGGLMDWLALLARWQARRLPRRRRGGGHRGGHGDGSAGAVR